MSEDFVIARSDRDRVQKMRAGLLILAKDKDATVATRRFCRFILEECGFAVPEPKPGADAAGEVMAAAVGDEGVAGCASAPETAEVEG